MREMSLFTFTQTHLKTVSIGMEENDRDGENTKKVRTEGMKIQYDVNHLIHTARWSVL